MASLMLHMAIAGKYCEVNKVDNILEFVSGNLAPDILPDKDSNHYLSGYFPSAYREAIMNRVNLSAFCKANRLISDYNRGFFLHLLTDYVFYTQYLRNLDTYKNMSDIPDEEMKIMMYLEYDRVSYYLVNKYSKYINLDILQPIARRTDSSPMEIFSEEGIDKFIDFCIHLDLDAVYEGIKNKDYSLICNINF
jgi:hypothetical protein